MNNEEYLKRWAQQMNEREPEPSCDCQKCQRRHEECAEFMKMDRPDYPYDRQWCHYYREEAEGSRTLGEMEAS